MGRGQLFGAKFRESRRRSVFESGRVREGKVGPMKDILKILKRLFRNEQD